MSNRRALKYPFCIQDWAGNLSSIPNTRDVFASFDDAEEALSEFLGDAYETDRQEYSITNLENGNE